MSKPDWKDLAKIGAEVGKRFAPGAFGPILDIVSQSLDDKDDPGNAEAIKALAEAVIALDKRLDKLER